MVQDCANPPSHFFCKLRSVFVRHVRRRRRPFCLAPFRSFGDAVTTWGRDRRSCIAGELPQSLAFRPGPVGCPALRGRRRDIWPSEHFVEVAAPLFHTGDAVIQCIRMAQGRPRRLEIGLTRVFPLAFPNHGITPLALGSTAPNKSKLAILRQLASLRTIQL